MMQRNEERREETSRGNWRDKPVDAERDKDIKEGGIGGARRDEKEKERQS